MPPGQQRHRGVAAGADDVLAGVCMCVLCACVLGSPSVTVFVAATVSVVILRIFWCSMLSCAEHSSMKSWMRRPESM